MATPKIRWGWREEENLVNSHAAARRLGGNWIAYGDEESKFLESCYKMDPTHRGTSATTLMVKSKQFRPETGSMYRFDFVEMVQINAQTGHRRSMKRVAVRDAQAAPPVEERGEVEGSDERAVASATNEAVADRVDVWLLERCLQSERDCKVAASGNSKPRHGAATWAERVAQACPKPISAQRVTV